MVAKNKGAFIVWIIVLIAIYFYGDENEDGIIEIVAIDKNEDNNFEINCKN